MKFCIVGTGLGGGTLATLLVKAGHQVVSIEAGGIKPSQFVRHENAGRNFGLRSTRAIQLGGTSNLWHGVLAPLDEIDFEPRDYVANSGWPIRYQELARYYPSAAEFLGLGPNAAFRLEELDEESRSLAGDIQFDRSIFRNKIFRQRVPPLNLRKVLLDLMKHNPNYLCMQNSPALELIYDDHRVKAVKVGKPDGSTALVEADVFVVSAGALETPRLLLNSGVDNKNIGKYLMDHPMGNLCQIQFEHPVHAPLYSDMRQRDGSKIKSGIELNSRYQREFKLLNHNFYLRPSFAKGIDDRSERLKLLLLSFRDGHLRLRDMWELLRNVNVILQILIYKFSLRVKYKYADLFFVTEQMPCAESRVGLAEQRDNWGYPIAKVNWQVSAQEIEQLDRWFDLCVQGGLSTGYRFSHQRKDINWNATFSSAAHHVGTCRMAESSATGVVSEDLKVFGTDNLYICDGSVFPTGGNVNSGLTIVALAHRLAEHLQTGVQS